MNLSSLPPDIWELMSPYIRLREACALMDTGALQLRRNLKAGLTFLHMNDFSLPKHFIGRVSEFTNTRTLNLSTVMRFTLPESWFERLPAGLRTLRLSNFEFPPKSLNRLPAQLRHIIFDGTERQDDRIAYLPQQLEIFESRTSFDPSLISKLPPTLTRLQFSSKLTNEQIELLPRSITSLEMDEAINITTAGVLLLPPSLTLLVLDNCKIKVEGFKALPKTLTSLRISRDTSLTSAVFDHLPPYLTWLRLPPSTESEMTEEQVKKLSRNLKAFDITNSRNLTPNSISFLPPDFYDHPTCLPKILRPYVVLPHFKRFRLSKLNFTAWMCDELIKIETWRLLPPHITFLDTFCLIDTGMPRTPNHEEWQLLPRQLHTLKLDKITNLPMDAVKHIPRQLQYLQAPKVNTLTDDAMSDLPPRLVFLDLSSATKFTDACIALLPRTLTALLLPKCPQITGKSFPDLPSELRVLDLKWAREVADSAVPHLPSTLTDLRLTSSALLTDACLEHLPSKLAIVDLSHAQNLSYAALRARFSDDAYLILPFGRSLERPW